MFIDTHCHLSKEDYDNIDTVLSDNREAGIEKIIISGCTRESIIESLLFVDQYEDVYTTIGYHPSEASFTTEEDLIKLEEQIQHPKVVGIGEIGLDYHYGKEDKDLQQELFRRQLFMADRHHLPVVIHSRDATEDTISILKEFPNVVGVIHCFSGSLETARIYLSMGYYLGIGGVVTFKNSKLGDVIQAIGLSSIPLEIKKDGLVMKFIESLPFKLTDAQQRAVNEILNDLHSTKPMQRLLQGDVGSGKTVVATIMLLAAIENGYQAAIYERYYKPILSKNIRTELIGTTWYYPDYTVTTPDKYTVQTTAKSFDADLLSRRYMREAADYFIVDTVAHPEKAVAAKYEEY